MAVLKDYWHEATPQTMAPLLCELLMWDTSSNNVPYWERQFAPERHSQTWHWSVGSESSNWSAILLNEFRAWTSKGARVAE